MTVEASSPVLIEKVRTTVSDERGLFRIVNLPPGTYTVTFALQGFNQVKRDGIELSGSFTAQIDADMTVGGLAETITVTGASPIVDVQSIRRQTTISSDVLTAIPTARSWAATALLIPGIVTIGGSPADVQVTPQMTVFGGAGGRSNEGRMQVDGLNTGAGLGGSGVSTYVADISNAQEVVTTTSGGLREAEVGGPTLSIIPKSGGNTISGNAYLAGVSKGMVGSNYTPELQAAGLTTPGKLLKQWDFTFGIGGPIIKVRLWYRVAARDEGQHRTIPNIFPNLNAGDPTKTLYLPDRTKAVRGAESWRLYTVRLTLQASSRDKINVHWDEQHPCNGATFTTDMDGCRQQPDNGDRIGPLGLGGLSGTTSLELGQYLHAHPRVRQLTWSNRATNRMLFEAGFGAYQAPFGPYESPGNTTRPLGRVTEQCAPICTANGGIPNLIYRSQNWADSWDAQYTWRASVSYVTGAHNPKIGYGGVALVSDLQNFTNDQNLAYTVNNGVPISLTQGLLPFTTSHRTRNMSLYVQDQWTRGRMTLQGALRFDRNCSSVPAICPLSPPDRQPNVYSHRMRILMTRLPFLFLIFICACSRPASQPAESASSNNASPAITAMPQFDAPRMLEHIKVLSSDQFEGRAPGSAGEELTVKYLEGEFKKLGLQPGNTDGTYIQNLPLVGITGANTRPLVVAGRGQKTSFRWRDDVVAWTRRVTDTVSLNNSELVFAGYGVTAPEFQWDDFKDVDIKGKTIVVLVNDPQIPDKADANKLDESLFRGTAMTYYGRWTYKFEEGARRGAAGILIVHETGPAGYPFSVVQGNLGERFDLVTPDKNMGRAAIEGWLSLDATKKLFAQAGHDFDQLRKQALTREFRPVPLNVTASIGLRNSMRTIQSKNVLAKLEGSDAQLRDEYVVYTAHWDHLGKGEAVDGDEIYNGALDNASGVAQLLEIARGFTTVEPRPKRSILFLMVGAEEQGLLGSQYYAEHPIYPLAKTLAAINIDGVNQWGRTKDVTVIGMGASDLDDYLRDAATEQGRTLRPDPESEKGFYYRSDHFNFAKQGVPALYADTGIDFVGKPAEYSQQKRDEYTNRDYHAPSDEIKPDWDLTGAADDGQLLFLVGYRVANAATFPEWKPGNEFKATRDAMLKK